MMEAGDYRQQQEQEEHYQAVAESLRALVRGEGTEEDVRLVCSAAAIDSRDIEPLIRTA